jgi:CheY-like chemotaxis protein
MKDDYDACIRAGANDYIAKPLDIDRLLSLARVWIAG